jgi:extracellular factor (EF) 3-hydroxypalmitic acid methyl ester biosynthesis protein
MSKELDERAATLGRAYASSMIMPLWMESPFHRRAYEKPLGYAGDYRMMELCFTDAFAGDRLFGRFLDSINKDSRFGRAVVAREVVLREAIRTVLVRESDDPARVLALAAGPAIEVRKLLDGIASLSRPVQLILLDQDRAAHESAHSHLTRILLERHRGMLPVSVQCVQFSVRQLLKPRTPEDKQVVDDTLANLDLIYSAGLYDYLPDPVALSLTRILYSRLRRGGRILAGNLVEAPELTWLMDYVFGWPLIYRTEDSLLRLANNLVPKPSNIGITPDATGRCLFLDITSPA